MLYEVITSIGKTEGYIEEMMAGQKVIKVFCHEKEAKAGFDAVNMVVQEPGKEENLIYAVSSSDACDMADGRNNFV